MRRKFSRVRKRKTHAHTHDLACRSTTLSAQPSSTHAWLQWRETKRKMNSKGPANKRWQKDIDSESDDAPANTSTHPPKKRTYHVELEEISYHELCPEVKHVDTTVCPIASWAVWKICSQMPLPARTTKRSPTKSRPFTLCAPGTEAKFSCSRHAYLSDGYPACIFCVSSSSACTCSATATLNPRSSIGTVRLPATRESLPLSSLQALTARPPQSCHHPLRSASRMSIVTGIRSIMPVGEGDPFVC
jgi:hypothetical protein